MKRLLLVLGLISLIAGTAGAAGKQRGNAGTPRPNILWIFLEDTSPYFGCYGDVINKGHTPTIDKMAKEGVLFERCYMPAPVCSPCRSALIVGAMQTTSGTHQHRSARVDVRRDKNPQNLYSLPAPFTTIPQLMRKAGYHTFNAGKDDYNFTYDRRDLYTSGNPDDYEYPHNGWQGRFGSKGSWNDRTDKKQPWFGQIMLWGGKGNLKNLPASETLAPGSVELPPYFPDTPEFQNAWTRHWSACRAADLDVKKILEDLKKDGELENTIVFFFSDHGDNQSLRHKQFCYEGGVQVPLVIQGNHPLIKKGQVRSEIMSGLDISATTLALAKAEMPDYLEGQDLFGKAYTPREFVVSARDRCDYTIDRIRTIRTDKYRYIRNFFPERTLLQPGYRDGHQTVKDLKRLHAEGKLTPLQTEIFFEVRPEEELYDIAKDIHQTNNLALDPAFKDELIKHRAILDKWIKETDDQGQYPESDAEMRAQVRFWKGCTVNPEFDKYEEELKFVQTATSPDGKLKPRIYADDDGTLTYDLKHGAIPIMLPSTMGITIDGVELGKGVVVKSVMVEKHEGAFEWLGTSSTVSNNYVAENFEVTQQKSGKKWTLETRCYDTGFAFRYVVPGAKEQTVNGESTTWNLPADAELWYRKNGGAFQTYWKKDNASGIDDGFNAQLNVTIELADGSYASLNEAGGFSFSGTSLKFNGSSEATTYFAGDKDGWTVRGDVVTPWRIVMTTPDLNTLVNCNLTAAVCPAPNKTLFPEGCRTDWIRPGRSLWQWWGYWNPGTLWEKQHWFVDNAAALGCQYYLVDEGWEHPAQGWITEDRTAWEALKELADYAGTKGIKLMVWRSYPANEGAYYEGMETVEKRTAFYKNCKKAGVFGAKIDFLNSENVEHSSFMHDCLVEAAGYELVINYHGAPKPKGGERTYPNQVSREGIVGMEHNKWETIPRNHYAITPFTRFIAGYGDFTITTFQPDFIKGTTSALQLAQAIVYTSPALHWADKPQYYLNSPAVDLIRSVPTTWDETIVLPSSKIGTQAAYARRKGQDWYVGIINGSDDAVQQALDLSFLGEGSFATTLFKDVPGKPVEKEKELLTTKKGGSSDVRMSPGGGFVAVFRKLEASPYGGPIYGKQTVALRSVEGAEVRYTLDGSEPTKSSKKYKKPFAVKKSCQLRAKVIKGDGEGAEISARFVELDVPMPEEDGDTVLRDGETVELMNLTSGEVYYTLEGTVPSTKSTRYEVPLQLNGNTVLKAITVVNGISSKVLEKSYQMQPAPAPLPQVKLTDLKPVSSTVGWDKVRINENLEGKAISVEGRKYESGILAHAPSVLKYRLKENYARFVAGMGVDDAKKKASVVFKVQVGDEVLAESPVIEPGLTWYFDVEIPKSQKAIKLIAEDAGDGRNSDHSAWVNAGFVTE